MLQSGAGAVLCFLFHALLVKAIMPPKSLDKPSELFATLKRSANQIKPFSHNRNEE
jgi:hypothetical protein